MSKSGLFAHFGSKEELQLATIEHARQIYVEQVILPGLAHSPASRRSRDFAIATLPSWSDVSFRAGAFSRRPWLNSMHDQGLSGDTIAALQRQWLDNARGAAGDGIDAGELDGSIDPIPTRL